MDKISHPLYQRISEQAFSLAPGFTAQSVIMGLNWTVATVENEKGQRFSGLCFSPMDYHRTLSWSGTLAGKSADELVDWLNSWDPCQAAVGMAIANALINGFSPLIEKADVLASQAPAHLQVFDYFFPQMKGQCVTVIGRYPGIEQYAREVNYQCIERRPQGRDYSDTAVEYLLPESDWVFITASSLANKTLPRLLELSCHAKVVLMGPTMPWLAEWKSYGLNFLAGVAIENPEYLTQTCAEGGGTRIFNGGVQYRLLSLD